MTSAAAVDRAAMVMSTTWTRQSEVVDLRLQSPISSTTQQPSANGSTSDLSPHTILTSSIMYMYVHTHLKLFLLCGHGLNQLFGQSSCPVVTHTTAS